jgi:hypothetical protein
VIVEGNSFLDFVAADFAITCARAGENRLKTSARRTVARADAIYLSTIDDCDGARAREQFDEWRAGLTIDLALDNRPVLTKDDMPALVSGIQVISERLICSRLSALSADGTSALPAL